MAVVMLPLHSMVADEGEVKDLIRDATANNAPTPEERSKAREELAALERYIALVRASLDFLDGKVN